MRVRILKDFSAEGRTYRAGEVVDVSFSEAYAWAKSGLVMQDKSLDGASETKVTVGPRPKGRSKKRTK